MHLQRNYNSLEPFPFSKFHLLRTCNRLVLPGTGIESCYGLMKDSQFEAKEKEDFQKGSKSPILDVLESSLTSVNSAEEIDLNEINKSAFLSTDIDLINGSPIVSPNVPGASSLPPLKHTSLPLPGFEYISSGDSNVRMSAPEFPDFPLIVNRAVFPGGFLNRRQRGEKRPIPDEQKDDKYYERRKRNNEAAKKSRDARKIREDRIAFRAALLEQENSLLRTQVVALRDELQAIRQLMASSTPSALMNLVM